MIQNNNPCVLQQTCGHLQSIEKKARLYHDWRKTSTIKQPDGDSFI